MGGIQDKEKVAEICGAIIGDGWIQGNGRGCFIAGDPLEDKEYYDEHLSKIFSEIICPIETKNFPYWKVYGIGLYKKKEIQKLLDFGLKKGKKVDIVTTPNWIKNGNSKIKQSFLRGFFDADGSVFCQKSYGKYNNKFDKKYHSKIRLRLTSISKELISEIFQICKELNLRVTLTKSKGGFRQNRNRSDVYRININELRSIEKWFEEIKPANKKHSTKYMIWKEHGFCPPFTTIKQRKDILKKGIKPYSYYT
ncbi:hypothetical protein HOD29_05195 [archaeon]|nr:hypothetical protein [archaeon]